MERENLFRDKLSAARREPKALRGSIRAGLCSLRYAVRVPGVRRLKRVSALAGTCRANLQGEQTDTKNSDARFLLTI